MSSRSAASISDDDDDDDDDDNDDDDEVMEVDMTDGATEVKSDKKMTKDKRPSISLNIPDGSKSTRERTGKLVHYLIMNVVLFFVFFFLFVFPFEYCFCLCHLS